MARLVQLVRARLSSLDDDDDGYSSMSSAASTPPLSPPPPLAAQTSSQPRPRVAAQLSSTDEDGSSDAFDDATSSGEDGDLLVEEVSNGFFFSVARVPPPPPPAEDPTSVPGDEIAFATEGSMEEGAFQVLDAATRSGLDGVIADGRGTGVEGSDDSETVAAAASGDLVGVSDNPGEQDVVGAGAVSDVVPAPFVADPGAGAGGIDALEERSGGSHHDISEFTAVMNGTEEEEDAGVEIRNSESDAKDSAARHEAVTDVEDVELLHAATRDGTSEPVEVRHNVDGLHSVSAGGHEASAYPASIPISGIDDAVELLGEELEDNVPASKGTRFGVYDPDEVKINDNDDDEVEVNGKDSEDFDYAALVELLRLANRSPRQGQTKVFPLETSEPRPLPPTDSGIPRTSAASSPVLEVDTDHENEMTDDEKKFYRKVDMARIKYLRLMHRLGYDTDNPVATQVLYRLSVAEGFKRFRIENHSSRLDNAWKRAVQLETEGIESLEFSCNVLVLGKTGVGKSATINSIFDEDKSETNAFLPATTSVNEVSGVVGGVKFRVIDTPGLGTSPMDEKSNRKVLNSVKKHMKRCPVDIILYVDRIDTLRQDENSLSLLRCITNVLGLSIWSKTIITLTHSAATPPEGPSGSTMNYEMVVTHWTHAIQQSIRQATNDPRIENPVALVENHHLCQRNTEGEKVLPNGLIWKRLLLLLCYSREMVNEIDSLTTRRAVSANLFGRYLRVPPLPYFLSSLLQSREHPRRANEQNLESVESDVDLDDLLNEDQGDEEEDYDQLPPFKPLNKSQVAKLSKEQQKLYFDEYDYRTELLKKKQLKEQLERLKEMKKREVNNYDVPADDDPPDDVYDTDRSPMADLALPSSFDSDDPVYRYRCLEPTPNLLVRAVTNPDGWDHDFGYDGLSLQQNLEVANKFPASLWIQVHKDKREFTIHLDSSMSAKHGNSGSTLAGVDIQTIMDQLAYTLRGETKIKNFKKNITTGGLSMTFVGNTMVTGAKIQDKLSVGNRLTLGANTGAISMRGDTAYGVNMEATLREKNYPVGQSLATLGACLVKWRKEWTMAVNLDSQISVGRTSNMAVHVDVNNKLTGRVSIKANTSEQLKIALLGICSATMYLWNRMHPDAGPNSERH